MADLQLSISWLQIWIEKLRKSFTAPLDLNQLDQLSRDSEQQQQQQHRNNNNNNRHTSGAAGSSSESDPENGQDVQVEMDSLDIVIPKPKSVYGSFYIRMGAVCK